MLRRWIEQLAIAERERLDGVLESGGEVESLMIRIILQGMDSALALLSRSAWVCC